MADKKSLRVVSVANQKGGVGKTTTAVNFSASLAVAGHKTLLVDLDPQGNASSGLGIDRYGAKTIYDVLIGRCDLSEAVQSGPHENLFVIPANQNLIGAEVELINAISREKKLKNALKSIKDDFQFVVFDCPPSLGLLTINAFTASTSLLIPIQCEYYAMEGLGQLLNTFQIVKEDLNEDLTIDGIVLTMFDPRNKLTHEVVKEMKAHFPSELLETPIPRNVKLSEAPSFGQPVILYDRESKGCLSYLQMTAEFLVRSGFENPDWKALFPNESAAKEEAEESVSSETLEAEVSEPVVQEESAELGASREEGRAASAPIEVKEEEQAADTQMEEAPSVPMTETDLSEKRIEDLKRLPDHTIQQFTQTEV